MTFHMWVYSLLKRMCLSKNFMIRDAPDSQKVPWSGWGSRLCVNVLSSSYKKAKGPRKLKNVFLQSTVNCVGDFDLRNSGRVSRLCVPLEDRKPPPAILSPTPHKPQDTHLNQYGILTLTHHKHPALNPQ